MKRIILCAVCAFTVTFAAAGSARAAADIGFKGLGGRLSFVSPEDVDATIGFGGLADLGTFAPQIGFGASVDYWSGSEGAADYSDFILGANSRYLFKLQNPKWKPYAGGGIAIHFFSLDIPAQNIGGVVIPAFDDSETKFGIDLFGGTSYVVNPKVDIVGDLMYRIATGDVANQFVISAGVIFWLGVGDE